MSGRASTAISPRAVHEELDGGEVPVWRHPEWMERFPWLLQGTTGAGAADRRFDLGLGGAQPVGGVLDRWRALRSALQTPAAVHARQVHAADLHLHDAPLPPGLLVMEGVDGHLCHQTGVLLTVSVADCVPVFLAHPESRAVALVHAGWRGTAAGILEAAVRMLQRELDAGPEGLWLHCGPAICSRCYEVGPEVHRAVHPQQPAPSRPTPIDLRAALVQRAAGVGVSPERCTVSGHCTRCGPGAFFSHRNGSPGRQVGVLARLR